MDFLIIIIIFIILYFVISLGVKSGIDKSVVGQLVKMKYGYNEDEKSFLDSNLDRQGEYRDFEDGVTIEIINSSNTPVNNLNFFFGFSEDRIVEELGNIEKLGPSEKAIFHQPLQNNTYYEHNLFMKLAKDNNQIQVNRLVNIALPTTSKVVVMINITGLNNEGNLLYKLNGFDGFNQFKQDLSSPVKES